MNDFPILFFDGGSRGNPGLAAGAAVLVMADGKEYTISKLLDYATNNEAEYTGLIIGLEKAKELGITQLEIRGDSNLVVNQIQGKWKIKSDRLESLCRQARNLIKNFDRTVINWIPREQNKLADRAANICMDGVGKIKPIAKTEETSPVEKPKSTTINGDNLANSVEKLVKLGSSAKFKDYLNLKSGRDRFTSKNLAELQTFVPAEVQSEISKEWNGNDTYLAKVYRWYLRGLPAKMAIKKVSVDAEVEEKFSKKNYPAKEKE
jgi:ribonuclease HI